MVKYRCDKCSKEMTVEAKTSVPECCGAKMAPVPLDVCTAPHDAETYRARNADDACDDGIR